jgi:hypothetical protein
MTVSKPKNIQSITDLLSDHANANAGTNRGSEMLRASLQKNGAGRSIVVDREGRIIAGNKTAEAAEAEHIPVRVVETDGSELVVVQRTDLDLTDPKGKARGLAFADNRIGEVNLNWDADAIKDAYAVGSLDGLDYLFSDDELNRIVGDALVVDYSTLDEMNEAAEEDGAADEPDYWAEKSDVTGAAADGKDFRFGDLGGKVDQDVYLDFESLVNRIRSRGVVMMSDIIAEVVRLAESGEVEDEGGE